MNFVQITDHACNIYSILAEYSLYSYSGERCGPGASGYVIRVIVYCISMHIFALLKNWFLVNKAAENFVFF